MNTTLNSLKTGYNDYFSFGSDIGALFVRAFPNSLTSDYFLNAFVPDEEIDKLRLKGTVKSLIREIKTYGCIDYVLWFGFFLDKTSKEALKEYYDILANYSLFEKSLSSWCDEFIEFCASNDTDGKTLPYKLTSDFICKKMLKITSTQSVAEIDELVSNKVKKEIEKFSVGTDAVRNSYAKIQCIGLLQYVYKRYDGNSAFCCYILKKLFTELNVSELPKTESRIAVLSSLIEAYIDASVVLSTQTNEDKTAGLGKAIFDFVNDAEGKNKELLDHLKKTKPSELQALLCFAMRHSVAERDYDTAANLFIRHYEYSREEQRKQTRSALLATYFLVSDNISALELFSIIKREQQRAPDAFTANDNSKIGNRFHEIVQRFTADAQSNIEKIKTSDLTEDKKVEAMQKESDRFSFVTSFFPQSEFFEQKLNKSMQRFLTRNRLPAQDLFKCLGDEEKNVVISYLRQGEMIYSLFKMLEGDRNEEEIYKKMDYSSALIELTKALEYIGNLIFRRISPQLLIQDNSFTDKNNNLISSITLGGFQFFFKRRVYNCLSCRNNANKNPNYTYLNDIIDIRKYRCNERNENRILEQIFDDFEFPRECRNMAAHDSPILPTLYEECESCLLDTYQQKQYFLWNVLYMVKDNIILTE